MLRLPFGPLCEEGKRCIESITIGEVAEALQGVVERPNQFSST